MPKKINRLESRTVYSRRKNDSLIIGLEVEVPADLIAEMAGIIEVEKKTGKKPTRTLNPVSKRAISGPSGRDDRLPTRRKEVMLWEWQDAFLRREARLRGWTFSKLLRVIIEDWALGPEAQK